MTRHPVAVDLTKSIARVATDVADLRDRVALLADLPAVVASHGRAIADLSGLAHQTATLAESGLVRPRVAGADGAGPGGNDDVAQGEDGAPVDPPPSWLSVTDPALAVAWLDELSVWVPAIWQPYLHTKTPGCWPWHPDIVAELLVVQFQWVAATVDGAGPDPLAIWHDRWRPGAAARVLKRMAGCERAFGNHKGDSSGREYRYDVACLDEVAEWWATTHGTDPDRPAPGLTLDGKS